MRGEEEEGGTVSRQPCVKHSVSGNYTCRMTLTAKARSRELCQELCEWPEAVHSLR